MANSQSAALEALALPNQKPAESDLVLLAHAVLLGLEDSTLVPLQPVEHDGWTPTVQRCHDNVEHWVSIHPECKPVQGWLYMDMGLICAARGIPRYVDLLPHTVLRSGAGHLLDITPRHADASGELYPFIRHPGPADEYTAFVDGRSIGRVRIYTAESPPRFVYSCNLSGRGGILRGRVAKPL